MGDATLTGEDIDELAREYGREEPFDTVEREQIETLPDALAAGEFGWRDVEWVVRWYYRRPGLGVSDDRRRTAEEQFGDNGYEAVADAIVRAVEATDTDGKVAALTSLDGVDVPVASAFLAFLHPNEFVAVDELVWGALREVSDLSRPYPDRVTPADYGEYLAAVRTVADRANRDCWTVYRALWRLD
jgi:hypothetical protein